MVECCFEDRSPVFVTIGRKHVVRGRLLEAKERKTQAGRGLSRLHLGVFVQQGEKAPSLLERRIRESGREIGEESQCLLELRAPVGERLRRRRVRVFELEPVRRELNLSSLEFFGVDVALDHEIGEAVELKIHGSEFFLRSTANALARRFVAFRKKIDRVARPGRDPRRNRNAHHAVHECGLDLAFARRGRTTDFISMPPSPAAVVSIGAAGSFLDAFAGEQPTTVSTVEQPAKEEVRVDVRTGRVAARNDSLYALEFDRRHHRRMFATVGVPLADDESGIEGILQDAVNIGELQRTSRDVAISSRHEAVRDGGPPCFRCRDVAGEQSSPDSFDQRGVAKRIDDEPRKVQRAAAWKDFRPIVVAMTLALAKGLDIFVG